MITVKTDPKLDLILDRVVDVPPALVWKAWTEPEHLMPWFCPLPWKTVECEIDLRPGGLFRTLMQGPNGESHPTEGCYLEVVKEQRLTWTNALGAGFRPLVVPAMIPAFTAVLSFEKKGQGTRYLVQGLHKDPAGKSAHEAMGFLDGWGKALDQLVVHCKTL